MKTLLAALFTVLMCAGVSGKDSCFDCHRVMEGTSLKFTNDIHFANAISCSDCHGGDRSQTNQNVAMNASRGFKVRVTRAGVPQYCANCHSDTAFMSKYEPQPRVDQFAKYQAGVHGKLLAAGRKRAAECVDCHSIHNIRAVRDPLSTASAGRISQTCGKCHATTLEAFAGTKHGQLFKTKRLPGCTVCHSAHDTDPATTAMLDGPNSVCARCHQPGSEQAKLAGEMAQYLAHLEASGPGAKDALARARIAAHGLNLEAMKKAAETVSPDAN